MFENAEQNIKRLKVKDVMSKTPILVDAERTVKRQPSRWIVLAAVVC